MDSADEVSLEDKEEVRDHARQALAYLEEDHTASMAQVLAAQECGRTEEEFDTVAPSTCRQPD